MSTEYIVVSGDYLSKIAKRFGFDDWRTIYNHPDNAAFRAKRPNPNLIYPGDRLMIPDMIAAISVAGAIEIPPDGNPNIRHFVTPRGGGRVTITLTIAPNNPTAAGQFTWEGASADPGNPLQASVPKSLAAKHTIKIMMNGQVVRELRVWVIWATITATDIPITHEEPVLLAGAGTGAFITGGFNFRHQIQPATVITDVDRPNLRGLKTVDPPGGNHPLSGDPLAGGANQKWDSSRQIKAKILNPNGLTNAAFAQPAPVAVAAYPINDVEGNDDRATGDETNNPYATGGVLTGVDSPGMGIDNAAGADGNTWERRLHFREFTRVELAGTWHRISDFFPWRLHVKFKKSGGKWLDNNTNKALDNSGF
jgi:hypothetical protein